MALDGYKGGSMHTNNVMCIPITNHNIAFPNLYGEYVGVNSKWNERMNCISPLAINHSCISEG